MSTEFQKNFKEAFFAYLEGEDSDVDFDIYAQDINDWAWLGEMVPGLVLSSAGGVLPFQAEGLYHGHPWYYKERYGQASLRVAQLNAENAYLPGELLFSAHEEVEEFRAGPGWISTILNLFENLEKSPFRYDFESYDVEFRRQSEEEKLAKRKMTVDDLIATDTLTERFGVCGWGHTPEEAYEYTKEISAYLLENGFSEEVQKKMWEMKRINPIPTNKDERDFSTVDFEFIVRVPEAWRDEDGKISIPESIFKAPE